MSKLIKEPRYFSYTWLAWLSVGMIVGNVFHTRLATIIFPFINTGLIIIWLVVSVLLFALYFYVSGQFHIVDMRFTVIDWLFLVSSVVIIATSGADFENISYFIRFFMLFIYILFMKYDEKLIKIMFTCLLAAAMVHVAATYFLYFNQDFYFRYVYPAFTPSEKSKLYYWNTINGYATGLASHFSLNGMNMAIALLLSVTLFLGGKKKKKWLYLLLALVSLVALFMTGKRAPLVFALFSIVVTYLVCAESYALRKLFMVMGGLLGGAILLYVASFNIEGIGATLSRFEAIFTNNESADISNGRFMLYGIALDYFKSAPIFGIGWRAFSKRVVVFFNEDSSFRDTHNVFLQLLCETGIVGAFVFFALFAVALIITIHLILAYKRNELELSDTARFGLTFSLMTQVFFLCYSMTGNPLYDTVTLYYYAFAVGSAATIYYQYELIPRERIKDKGKRQSKYIKNS